MISFLNKSQRPLVAGARFSTKNSSTTNTRLLSSAATTTSNKTTASHHQAPSTKEDPERLLDMYNNEKQSVLEDLDHPDNRPIEETTATPEHDANSVFDE